MAGLFTGAMTRERIANLPAEDWRRHNPEFQKPKLSKNLELVERLRAIGARNAKQVDGIVGALTFRLTPDEIKEIEVDR
jgi:aryl-alcohol dehydrogenase-like predicted oxidoreductase